MYVRKGLSWKYNVRLPGRQYIPRENNINQWDVHEQAPDLVSLTSPLTTAQPAGLQF